MTNSMKERVNKGKCNVDKQKGKSKSNSNIIEVFKCESESTKKLTIFYTKFYQCTYLMRRYCV